MIPADVWHVAVGAAALVLAPAAFRVVLVALWEARQDREQREAVNHICERVQRCRR